MTATAYLLTAPLPRPNSAAVVNRLPKTHGFDAHIYEGAFGDYWTSKIAYLNSISLSRADLIREEEAKQWRELIVGPYKDFKRDLWYQRYLVALKAREDFEANCISHRQLVAEAEEDEARLMIYETWLVEYRTILRTDQLKRSQRIAEQKALIEATEEKKIQQKEMYEVFLRATEGMESLSRDERRMRIEIEQEAFTIPSEVLELYDEELAAARTAEGKRVELERKSSIAQRDGVESEESVCRQRLVSDERVNRHVIELIYDQEESKRYWLRQITTPSKWGERLALSP